MTSPAKYLTEWFVRYTKNRDLMFRKISEVKEDGDMISVVQKDGKIFNYCSAPFPEDMVKVAECIDGETKGILVYNTQSNFDLMMKSWKALSNIKGLTIYFINPFSKLDKRWAINPYTHSRISDAESLDQGLNSMYMMVEPTTRSQVEELTR
ncbi:MAG: hypothetical protein ABIA62_03175 [Candidatus Woesearchaeota archaeon]